MARHTLIIFITVLCVSLTNGLRILVFFPAASKSHSILGHGVVRNLLEAGHEVVHITAFPKDKPNNKLTEISVEAVGEKIKKDSEKIAEYFKLKNMVGKGHNMIGSFLASYFAYNFHKEVFNDEGVVRILSNPNEKFDAVVVEWFFSNIPAGMAPLFRCPLIWFGSTEAHWQILEIMDEISNPAYSVDLFSTNRAPLTLTERILEVSVLAVKYFFVNPVQVAFEKYVYKSVFSAIAAKRGVTMPSYSEAVYNGSILLLNSHPSIGTAYRLPQSAKYIAGFHIDPKVKPLPKNLQKLMDEAKHGVIYFSMGSNLNSSDMSEAMRDSLLEMFGRLEQTVLWKFETDLKRVPPNVHLVKWAPQQSIFAHPNLKLFISHGGQLSTTEAVHFGVPVVGIPVFGDQHVNMRSIASKGIGVAVPLTEDLAKNLYLAVREVLTNSSYKATAEEISMWYHSRVKPPGEELVHWIEYAVTTQGAPHLRSPALDVPCYQKLHLDIIVIFIALVTLLVFTVRRLCKLWKGNKKQKKKQH